MRQVSRRKLIVGTAAALLASAAPAQNDSGTGLPPADQAEVNAKYANVIRKHGERLSEAQRTRAREALVRHQRMLMRVRDFALENGDGPPPAAGGAAVIDENRIWLPIGELAPRIRERKLSPVELTEAFLGRSERLGGKLNAYASLTHDLALEQARTAEREIAAGRYRGPLHGIPCAPKDLVAVKGRKTTWGAPPFADQQFDFDAAVIERLNRAGAVMIGKAAMIELAGGLGYSGGEASLTAPAHNPWSPDCWTCGSSSGSGAVVSSGLAVFSIGSDTRGSIICPTSWCGISGMRPSFGRVSRYGAMAIAWSMDKLGPMARTADDCGLILAAIAGHDPRDHDSLPEAVAAFPYPSAAAEPRKPLRIGKATNAWPPNPALERLIDDAMRAMEKTGAKIVDVKLPDGPYEDAAELTILMEAASSFRNLIHSGNCAKLVDPLGQINGYVSEEFSASDYLDVQRIRTILQHRMDELFDDFDVIAAAGSDSVARPLARPPAGAGRGGRGGGGGRTEVNQHAPDGISSLCGLPALSVPCGFSAEGLPYGVQFLARATNDHAVVAAARSYQEVTDWHRKHPA